MSFPKVNIQALQERPGKARPWIVRWTVDGVTASESFPTKEAAKSFWGDLISANNKRDEFSRITKRPVSWTQAPVGETWASWSVDWHAGEWDTSAQRTRKSRVEALARIAVLAVRPGAPKPPARPLIYEWYNTAASTALGRTVDWDTPAGKWLAKWSLPLADMTPRVCDTIDSGLAKGDQGQAVSPARYRKVGRQCLSVAVDLELLPVQPWKAPQRGKRRKVVKQSKPKLDLDVLPEPVVAGDIIAGMRSHQPASLTYQRMSECILRAGFRPSEVLDVDVEDLYLPTEPGVWGWAKIWHSDQRAGAQYQDLDDKDSGDTKTGEFRIVPLHPSLVLILRAAVADRRTFTAKDRGGRAAVDPDQGRAGTALWVTVSGRRPSPSNWQRAFARARTDDRLHLYHLRHTHATAALRAGVPLGEVARRLGHTVETLTRIYAGVLEGDEGLGNDRLKSVFDF